MTGLRMKEIKQRAINADSHFFDRAAMRFFDSKIERGVYQGIGGVFFITSEQFHGSSGSAPRKWSIRQFDPDTNDIDTYGEFNAIDSLPQAKRLARLAASGVLKR